MSYRILLEKENFKFSVAHFTIFGPDRAERLHGHNYYVGLEIVLGSVDSGLGMAFDFNDVKPLVRELTASLDEMTLLPERSPYLTIEKRPGSIRAMLGKKAYEFPEEDVKLLPLTNVTGEELARWLSENLSERIRAQAALAARVEEIVVSVQETRGQSVIHRARL